MSREAAGHTLQTTALVNDAYLKLIEIKKVDLSGSDHDCGRVGSPIDTLLIGWSMLAQGEDAKFTRKIGSEEYRSRVQARTGPGMHP